MSVDETAFKAVLRAGLYMEHVKNPGTNRKPRHWEVIDINGRCLTAAIDEDEALDKAYRVWRRRQEKVAR